MIKMRNKDDILFGDKLRLAWYFEKPAEKIILLLSFIALIYSIFRIIIQGFW